MVMGWISLSVLHRSVRKLDHRLTQPRVRGLSDFWHIWVHYGGCVSLLARGEWLEHLQTVILCAHFGAIDVD